MKYKTSAYKLISRINEEYMVCDDCKHSDRCANEYLACNRFASYLIGKKCPDYVIRKYKHKDDVLIDNTLPNHKIYKRIFESSD